MTSIKPPSGLSTTLPHSLGDVPATGSTASPGGPGALTGAGPSSETQRPSDARDVHGATHGRASSGEDATVSSLGPGKTVNLVDLARAVETGQLSMTQAVERLVEGTVGSLPGALTELERAELSELLRQAVKSDPTLSSLQDDHG
jgi:hypothetical protein